MNIKVKICGICDLQIAENSIKMGADFLGFNFVEKSKRYIRPEIALAILKVINRGGVKIVGVFQEAKPETIKIISKYLNLDYVQIHGNDSFEGLNGLPRKIIKVFNIGADFDEKELMQKMNKIGAEYFLIDRQIQGEGKTVDLEKAEYLASKFPIFLAGGLDPENVRDAVLKIKPFAVDVASGIETNGKKDLGKIEKFIKMAKGIWYEN